ncbi:hypothetical protein [Rhizorhabdus argentea]|uniref:hypothetical protein n=1 Tax=Rhizorhabdus argentea TaxID=1387174 RepID=UPI0030EC4852
MNFERLRSLRGQECGKAALKLVLGSCLLAAAFATSSPAFQANPLLGKTVNEIRQHLPATFDRITDAMGGRG